VYDVHTQTTNYVFLTISLCIVLFTIVSFLLIFAFLFSVFTVCVFALLLPRQNKVYKKLYKINSIIAAQATLLPTTAGPIHVCNNLSTVC